MHKDARANVRWEFVRNKKSESELVWGLINSLVGREKAHSSEESFRRKAVFRVLDVTDEGFVQVPLSCTLYLQARAMGNL